MATQRTSFAKLQRDRDRQVRAAAKRERRQNRETTTEEPEDAGLMLEGIDGELSAPDLLKLVEAVHQQFEAGVIDFETFENTKTELLSRLPVD